MVAMVAMVTDFIFFIIFSLDNEWAWVANHFDVLHDILYELFDARYHKRPQKYPIIGQNWPFYDRFMVAMVTEFFFHYFSFQPGGAWLAGHFGVLHDLLYVIIDVWGC